METNKNEFYSISVADTKKYGIVAAAIIGRVRFWCEYNKKNKIKDRFHDGEWWSGFMNQEAFALQLGIPVKTIEKHLPKLIKNGILIKDNFNKRKYDRTSWYRVNPSPQIEGTIPPNWGNGNPQIEGMDTPKMGGPIPVNHTYNHSVNQTGTHTGNQKLTDIELLNQKIEKLTIEINNKKLEPEYRNKLVEERFNLYEQKKILVRK
jgi:hypothetical protein